MTKEIDIQISLRLKTKKPEKTDWIIEAIMGMLLQDDEISKVCLDVQQK